MKKTRIKAIAVLLISMLLPLQVMAAEPQNADTAVMPDKISVEGGYLEKISEEPMTREADAMLRYQYRVVISSGTLSVREHPGTQYAIVGRLANGTVVEIPFMQPGDIEEPWLYTTQPIEGYVNGDYIR